MREPASKAEWPAAVGPLGPEVVGQSGLLTGTARDPRVTGRVGHLFEAGFSELDNTVMATEGV